MMPIIIIFLEFMSRTFACAVGDNPVRPFDQDDNNTFILEKCSDPYSEQYNLISADTKKDVTKQYVSMTDHIRAQDGIAHIGFTSVKEHGTRFSFNTESQNPHLTWNRYTRLRGRATPTFQPPAGALKSVLLWDGANWWESRGSEFVISNDPPAPWVTPQAWLPSQPTPLPKLVKRWSNTNGFPKLVKKQPPSTAEPNTVP